MNVEFAYWSWRISSMYGTKWNIEAGEFQVCKAQNEIP